MLDQLGCGPQDILHVSSSLRYDLVPAHDLRIQKQGLRQPRLRAQYALLRLPRGRLFRRPRRTARRLKPLARARPRDCSPCLGTPTPAALGSQPTKGNANMKRRDIFINVAKPGPRDQAGSTSPSGSGRSTGIPGTSGARCSRRWQAAATGHRVLLWSSSPPRPRARCGPRSRTPSTLSIPTTRATRPRPGTCLLRRHQGRRRRGRRTSLQVHPRRRPVRTHAAHPRGRRRGGLRRVLNGSPPTGAPSDQHRDQGKPGHESPGARGWLAKREGRNGSSSACGASCITSSAISSPAIRPMVAPLWVKAM